MKIYWRTLLQKCDKESDDFPFGIRFYDGVQGAGKTLSMVFDAVQLQKKYKDVNVISNVKIDYPFKSFNYFDSVDELISLLNNSDSNKHTIVIIDEALTYFAENGGIDPALMSRITQNRKVRRFIFVATQKFKRTNNRLRDFSLETVRCGSFLNLQINIVRDDTRLRWDKEEMDFIGDKKFTYIFKRNNKVYALFDTYATTKINKDIKTGNLLTAGVSPPRDQAELQVKVKKGWF